MDEMGPRSIEWMEFSGPVSPRYHYLQQVTVEAGPQGVNATWERKDAAGNRRRAASLDPASFERLWDELTAHLPLGSHLDLAAPLRHRKGISFNHVRISDGRASARLDYVLSQREEDGEPKVRSVLEALERELAFLRPEPEG